MVAALRLSRVLTLALLVSAAAAQAMAPAPAMSVEDVMAMLEAEVGRGPLKGQVTCACFALRRPPPACRGPDAAQGHLLMAQGGGGGAQAAPDRICPSFPPRQRPALAACRTSALACHITPRLA